MINLLAAAIITFIGTLSDLKQANRIVKELHLPHGKEVRILRIVDRAAHQRFKKWKGPYYRALWGNAVDKIRGRYHNYSSNIYIALVNETTVGAWKDNSCVDGQTITCEAKNIKECAAAVNQTWCACSRRGDCYHD
jgi:hypothetical protein